MDYISAKARALNLTSERKQDHIIILNAGQYHVCLPQHWTGDIFETVKFTPDENKIDDKTNKKTSKVRDYPNPSEDKPETV